MLITLAFRHLLTRKLRSAVLLLGYVFGVAAMIVLLSVGQAMLEQSRDVSLVGGGEVTVLPQGIDIEALRTGAASVQFFGIDRARFMARQLLGGPRHAGLIETVAPVIERKSVYLEHAGRTIAVRAGGEIPSRNRALEAGLTVLAGRWDDAKADSIYFAPTAQQLYDELDRFHIPPSSDSTWAEWHYFNVVTGANEWLYITYFVRGNVREGKGGGVLLVTRRRPDGRYEDFTAVVPPNEVVFHTDRADVSIGENTVQQRDGVYYLEGMARGDAGAVRIDLELQPRKNRYFPPVEVNEGDVVSGYVVPALSASVSGTVCFAGRCAELSDAPGYHDHNWGIWREATWEWGSGRGAELDVVYGGVYSADEPISPFFLAVVDSLGPRQVFRFRGIDYRDFRPVPGTPVAQAPGRLVMTAYHDADTLQLDVIVRHARATLGGIDALQRYFVQMRGDFRLSGRITGQVVVDSGSGFFETYVSVGNRLTE